MAHSRVPHNTAASTEQERARETGGGGRGTGGISLITDTALLVLAFHCTLELHVDMFMHFAKPLLTIFGGLTPPYNLLPRRFPLNAVCDACEDDEETKEALTTHGMRVNEARSQDRQYNTRVHYNRKNNSTEATNSLKDKYLSNGVADGEEDDVAVHVGVSHQKNHETLELLRVYEGDKGEHERERVHHKHHMSGR